MNLRPGPESMRHPRRPRLHGRGQHADQHATPRRRATRWPATSPATPAATRATPPAAPVTPITTCPQPETAVKLPGALHRLADEAQVVHRPRVQVERGLLVLPGGSGRMGWIFAMVSTMRGASGACQVLCDVKQPACREKRWIRGATGSNFVRAVPLRRPLPLVPRGEGRRGRWILRLDYLYCTSSARRPLSRPLPPKTLGEGDALRPGTMRRASRMRIREREVSPSPALFVGEGVGGEGPMGRSHHLRGRGGR